ncbi:MAG: alpha/beta hydrolase, partial [Acidimicrobiales bacterium]|nr:alpha/beta hydrolase [Acidimicrobiales bacterium]
MVGLSGGGPYTLASAHELSDRIKAVGVLGGVAPTVGVDAIGGGAVSIARYAAPALKVIRVPMAMGLTGVLRAARPFANTAIDLYARSSPEGDRELLGRPEFKAMFLDDILNASRKQISAPLADVLLFARHWGFELADVEVPVTWWHGDADHIVPFEHGEHMVKRLPTAELRRLPGQSHLGGLGVGEEVLDTLLAAKR